MNSRRVVERFDVVTDDGGRFCLIEWRDVSGHRFVETTDEDHCNELDDGTYIRVCDA